MKTDADMVTTERIESIIEMLDSVIGDGTLLNISDADLVIIRRLLRQITNDREDAEFLRQRRRWER